MQTRRFLFLCVQAAGSQEELLRSVGEGGFLASEFELQEILGQINVQQARRAWGYLKCKRF